MTKVSITIAVQEDQPGIAPGGFTLSREIPLDPTDLSSRFSAVVSVAQDILGAVHRKYVPTPEEAAEDAKEAGQ